MASFPRSSSSIKGATAASSFTEPPFLQTFSAIFERSSLSMKGAIAGRSERVHPLPSFSRASLPRSSSSINGATAAISATEQPLSTHLCAITARDSELTNGASSASWARVILSRFSSIFSCACAGVIIGAVSASSSAVMSSGFSPADISSTIFAARGLQSISSIDTPNIRERSPSFDMSGILSPRSQLETA